LKSRYRICLEFKRYVRSGRNSSVARLRMDGAVTARSKPCAVLVSWWPGVLVSHPAPWCPGHHLQVPRSASLVSRIPGQHDPTSSPVALLVWSAFVLVFSPAGFGALLGDPVSFWSGFVYCAHRNGLQCVLCSLVSPLCRRYRWRDPDAFCGRLDTFQRQRLPGLESFTLFGWR
jgi:hypothetical protein